jgi:hypothetical protein
MPFEGADACGAEAGAGAGAACFGGLAAGAGVGVAATVACDCFAAAGEFELLSLLPPQLATPTAMSRIAAPLARKVIGLLRFMVGPPVRVWGSGRFPAVRPLVVGPRETPWSATGEVVRAAGDAVEDHPARNRGPRHEKGPLGGRFLDGPYRDRTCDLEIKSLLLYQLS